MHPCPEENTHLHSEAWDVLRGVEDPCGHPIHGLDPELKPGIYTEVEAVFCGGSLEEVQHFPCFTGGALRSSAPGVEPGSQGLWRLPAQSPV